MEKKTKTLRGSAYAYLILIEENGVQETISQENQRNELEYSGNFLCLQLHFPKLDEYIQIWMHQSHLSHSFLTGARGALLTYTFH